MTVLAWFDRMVVRLAKLDERAGVRSSTGSAAPGSASEQGRWRRRPVFYWAHRWGRLDPLAVIAMIMGVFGIAISITDGHYVDAVRWFAVAALGAVVFAVLSLMPNGRD